MADYLPTRITDRVAWSTRFYEGITTTAAEIGLSEPQCVQYGTLHTAFVTAAAESGVR